jgi:hypothetical protein
MNTVHAVLSYLRFVLILSSYLTKRRHSDSCIFFSLPKQNFARISEEHIASIFMTATLASRPRRHVPILSAGLGHDDYYDHVDRVRLYLRTAATNGPIIHPQVTHEHGETRWNDIDRRKLLIHSPELSSNPTSSYLIGSRRNGRRELCILPCQVFLFTLASDFLLKMLLHGSPALLPLPR